MKKLQILRASVLFAAVWFSGCDSERHTAEEKFAAVQKKMMAAVSELTRMPPDSAAPDEAYITGKIAVFNKAKIVAKERDADGKTFFMTPLYFREMETNYAAAPDEVGTVAIVNCDALQKGVYKTDDGREYPAEVEDCELTMIDRAKQKVILKRKFEKTPSGERRAYGNSVIRQTAQDDVLHFLKSLPQK